MADFNYKAGDTAPIFAITCAFSDGTVKDLSGGATATIAMWNAVSRGTPKLNDVSITITDGPNGKVSYAWGANDLDTVGAYHWEVHTVDATGKKDSFPDGEYGTLIIKPRIKP